jgi:tryptophanyl-tRNA synthetase
MRSLSGIQPSGRLHLGNYYGALRQFLELQGQGEALYFLADLHALTTVRDGPRLRALTREAAAGYLALGLDPARAVLFRQSDVPQVCELYWILGTVVPLSNLERAHGYKDKLARGLGADLGLFAYPVLMAADILVYGADLVPVGRDQLQHLELTRDWATKFNATFVEGYDPADPEGREPGHAPGILKLPRAQVRAEAAVVPGTDGEKMSKSRGNAIDLFGDDGEVRKRIMGVRTDSTPVAEPKPLEAPLHQLLRLVLPADEFREIDRTWRAGGVGYGEYKRRLLEGFHAAFDGARRRYRELSSDPQSVEQVLREGAERARALAAPVLASVRRAVGLG